MPRQRGGEVKAFVKVQGDLNYGFSVNKNRHQQYGAELGQTTFDGRQGVFFGAESPKPNRAEKQLSGGNGTVSSFISAGKENTLQKAGWVIKRTGSIRGISSTAISLAVYVPMPGNYNYAWQLTKDMADVMAILGIQAAAGDTADMVWGSDPSPPRASKRIQGTNSRMSTFIQPKNSIIIAAVQAGWSITKIDYDLIPDA
ncbi:MAG TPA: hypothetical protein V6D25_31005 [Leptolyngbyaceae cyanobacterium]